MFGTQDLNMSYDTSIHKKKFEKISRKKLKIRLYLQYAYPNSPIFL